ncbi:hypothetical protein ACET3Z_004964 [Daucus carota]
MAAEELEDFHNTGEPVIVKDVDVMEIDKNEFTDERKVGVPVQAGTKDCGLFVMRYMKEIVQDKDLDFANKVLVREGRFQIELCWFLLIKLFSGLNCWFVNLVGWGDLLGY